MVVSLFSPERGKLNMSPLPQPMQHSGLNPSPCSLFEVKANLQALRQNNDVQQMALAQELHTMQSRISRCESLKTLRWFNEEETQQLAQFFACPKTLLQYRPEPLVAFKLEQCSSLTAIDLPQDLLEAKSNLLFYRLRQNLSAQLLASRLSLPENVVISWEEYCSEQWPSMEQCLSLMQLLQCPPDALRMKACALGLSNKHRVTVFPPSTIYGYQQRQQRLATATMQTMDPMKPMETKEPTTPALAVQPQTAQTDPVDPARISVPELPDLPVKASKAEAEMEMLAPIAASLAASVDSTTLLPPLPLTSAAPTLLAETEATKPSPETVEILASGNVANLRWVMPQLKPKLRSVPSFHGCANITNWSRLTDCKCDALQYIALQVTDSSLHATLGINTGDDVIVDVKQRDRYTLIGKLVAILLPDKATTVRYIGRRHHKWVISNSKHMAKAQPLPPSFGVLGRVVSCCKQNF